MYIRYGSMQLWVYQTTSSMQITMQLHHDCMHESAGYATNTQRGSVVCTCAILLGYAFISSVANHYNARPMVHHFLVPMSSSQTWQRVSNSSLKTLCIKAKANTLGNDNHRHLLFLKEHWLCQDG